MKKKSDHLSLFAKYWEPGKVKTRLAASIGDTSASELYFVFLNTLMTRYRDVGDDRTLVFSPPDREPEFQRFVTEEWIVHPQSEGDLGDRLSQHSSWILGTPSAPKNTNLIILGTDCLELDSTFIDSAFRKLDEHDVVLGPSFDGGYYLVGMSCPVPAIFESISWSTPAVFQQTVDQLTANQISFHILETHHDIDELEDLKGLSQRLEETCATQSAHTRPLEAPLIDKIQSVLENN